MLQTTKIILIFDISSNTATVLILRGSLLPSSHIICGTTYAKVRQLIDSNGKQLKQAGPGDAVIVSGWKDLPRAGDEVLQGEEDDVKKAVQNRLRRVQLNATLHDAEAINAQRRSERERKEEESNQASTILNALPQPDTRLIALYVNLIFVTHIIKIGRLNIRGFQHIARFELNFNKQLNLIRARCLTCNN